jgi:hypothetical protein
VYYWRLKAYDRAHAESGWTGSQPFTYTAVAPQLPAAYFPPDDSVLFPTEALSWTRSIDASRGLRDSIWYILQVSATAAFSNIVSADTITDTERVVQNLKGYGQLMDDNRYYWRLSAFDNHGSLNGPSPVKRFYLNKTNNPPSMPVIIAPKDSLVVKKGALFNWHKATDPDPSNTVSYRIIGAPDSSFTDTVLSVAGIQDTVISVDSLLVKNTIIKPDTALKPSPDTGGFLDDHFYYWNVVAFDNHNAPSPVGAAGYIYFNPVNDTPGIATNLQPAFGLMTFPTSFLQWKAPAKNEFRTPLRATLQFATDSLFAAPLFEDTAVQAQQLQVGILHDTASLKVQISALHDTALIPKEKFLFWRVKMIGGGGVTHGYSAPAKLYFSAHNSPPAVVTGLNPSDSSLTLYPTDMLSWNPSIDPELDSVYYQVWISASPFDTTADSTIRLASVNNLSAPQIKLSALPQGYSRLTTGSVYFWRVRSRDVHFAYAGWSNLASLRFRSTPPTLVGGLQPADNTILRFSDTLRWNKAIDNDAGIGDTVRYIVSVVKYGDTTKLSLDTIIGDTTLALKAMKGLSRLQNNQSYAWQVRSMDAHGAAADVSASAIFVYNLTNSPPTQPVIVWPDTSRARLLRPFEALRWNSTDPEHDSIYYRIEIARDSSFVNQILIASNWKYSQIALNQIGGYAAKLQADSTYFWRVKAADSKGAESPYSRLGAFIYDAFDHLATAPVIIEPVNNAYLTENTRLSWKNSTDVDDSIIRYRVMVYADTTDTLLTALDSIAAGDSGRTTILFSSLLNRSALTRNHFYYWKVSPRSLVDTSWVEGNGSGWRRMLYGDTLIAGDSRIAQVMVVLPNDSTTHEVRSSDSAVTILFNAQSFQKPVAVRISKLTVDGTIGASGAVGAPSDSGLRVLQKKVAAGDQFALGDPTMYWVREPAFAIQTFSLDSTDTSRGALHDSVMLQIAYHDTNQDGYVDGEERIPVKDLWIFRLNESSQRWEPVMQALDTTNNTASANTAAAKKLAKARAVRRRNSLQVVTGHFSVYSVLAYKASSEPFSDFKVYPSPFLLGKGGVTANIAYRLNEKAKILIHIYSKTGGLVWERTIASGDPLYGSPQPQEIQVPWDGRNAVGRYVGSGMYVVKAQVKVESGHVYNTTQYLGVVR